MRTLFTRVNAVHALPAALAGVLALAGCTRPPPPPQNTPAPVVNAEPEPAPPTAAPEPTAAPPANAPNAAPVPVKKLPPKVKIIVRVIPAKPPATVFWGKKKLGDTPVTLERPRDSGPVDLVVREDGFFPVHTRAYTFRNDVVYVRLTKLDDRMTLFGAKHDQPTQLPAPPPGSDPTAPVAAPPAPAPAPAPVAPTP